MKNLLLAILLVSTGCAMPQPITRVVTVAPQIPTPLLNCAPSPAVPVTDSQAVVAEYIISLWQAGQDCRAHVKAIKDALAD